MTREQVRMDLINVIQPFARIDAKKELKDSVTLVDDLGVDSARMVDIILDLEDKFTITISDAEADRLTNVGSAVDLVYSKVSQVA